MKILQINAVYGNGSTGVITQDVHNLAIKNGIEAFVAYSTSSLSACEIPGGYKIGGVVGKKIHALLYRLSGLQGYYSSFSTKKLLKRMTEINPDVVVLHNLHSNYINVNILLDFLAKRRIKTVAILHDCWFYTGGCFHYTSVGCEKWKENCGSCPRLKGIKSHLLDKSSKILKERKKYFDAINDLTVVGVSKWIAEEAEKTFFKEKEVTYIYNGVDTEIFKPTHSDFREKYGLENKFIILGPASKWLSGINKETFEKTVKALSEEDVLVLLGCNEEQRKILPEKVIALPFIRDRKELAEVYSAADVFVNCTREDSFSLINAEAQACGTPVVTYSNTGAKETVDGNSGFRAENGNADELLMYIKKVKEEGKPTFSELCRKWAVENFDKEKNYEKYIRLFQAEDRGVTSED